MKLVYRLCENVFLMQILCGMSLWQSILKQQKGVVWQSKINKGSSLCVKLAKEVLT